MLQSVVPKKMFIEFAIHKTAHAIGVFFACFPKTRTWNIISKFDLNFVAWANTFPVQKNRFWFPIVCVTWKILSWLAGTVLFCYLCHFCFKSHKVVPQEWSKCQKWFPAFQKTKKLKTKYLGWKQVYNKCLSKNLYKNIIVCTCQLKMSGFHTLSFFFHPIKWHIEFPKQNIQEAVFFWTSLS